MYKIYCLNNISPEGLALLTDNYEVTENIDEADAILVRSADMHEMEVPANLKAVARAGAGVNNIPLDKFAEAGIAVFNTPGANANAVKELVLAGMLLASRDIIGGVAWVRDNADDENVGKAAEKAKKQFAGGEILGKTLGVIGLGAIGKLVAQSAEALGMKVIGYDPAMDEITVHEQISPTVEFADLPKVLKESDFITIHVPAMDATKRMINADTIAQMKDGVVFLNFSRDVLVDDAAMAEALASGKVAAYVTDFANPAVVKMERAIVIPHLGASTAEAEDNCAMMAVRELMDYLENGNIANSVNYPACDMGPVPDGLRRVAVLHANVPNAIARITNVFGDAGVNIENMMNKARGENAYTMLDLDAGTPGHPDDAIERLSAIEGVRRVRVVK